MLSVFSPGFLQIFLAKYSDFHRYVIHRDSNSVMSRRTSLHAARRKSPSAGMGGTKEVEDGLIRYGNRKLLGESVCKSLMSPEE